MTEKKPGKNERYIIRASSPQYVEAIQRLYKSKLSKAQIHRVLDITKGNVIGLKIAAPDDRSKIIWFNYQGKRYDIKPNGVIFSERKLGAEYQAPKHLQKTIRCQLCGESAEIPSYDISAKCPKCGFPLRKYRVNLKR